jgi:hypothetical protein
MAIRAAAAAAAAAVSQGQRHIVSISTAADKASRKNSCSLKAVIHLFPTRQINRPYECDNVS